MMMDAGPSEHLARVDVVWSAVSLRGRRSSTGGRIEVHGDQTQNVDALRNPRGAAAPVYVPLNLLVSLDHNIDEW